VALEAGLVARELEPLRAFYTGIMGFRLVNQRHFDVGTVHKFQRDAARLKIFVSAEAIDPACEANPWFRPGGWRYAALYLDGFDDVDELVNAVRASAGRVLVEPTSHRWDARMALIADPEGNVWEILAEAHEPRKPT
jgi:catechol 2,3-dioxygenase-like lactoylglutathione lyase family enzyme